MHYRRNSLCLLLFLSFWTVVAQATAATTYNYFYTAGQTSYTAAPSSNVVVNVYLQEVNSDQSTQSLLTNEHGLFEAGVKITEISGFATITTAAPNSGTVPTGFDDPTSSGVVNSLTISTISESTDPPPFGTDTIGVEPGSQSNGVSSVFLGSITIHTGSLGGQTSVFTIATDDPTNGATFTNDHNYDLDNNIDPHNPAGASALYNSAASTNFSVTTSTPEPASGAFLAATAVILTRPRRREAISV